MPASGDPPATRPPAARPAGLRVAQQPGPGQRRVTGSRAAGPILQQAPHGLRRVGLVRADHPGRAALQPAGHVLPRQRRAVGAEYPAAVVRHDRGPLVERDPGQRHALIPDAAQHHARVQRLQLAGPGEHALVVQPGPLQHQPADPLLAGDLHRPQPEPQREPARLAGELAPGPAADHRVVAADPPVGSNAPRSASRDGTVTSTPPSSPSSRNSLVVNLAWAGPRRPITCTSRTLLAVSASSTGCGTSVPRSSAGSRTRMRATSTATLPTPITATDSASSVNASGSTSGCPQYQLTKSVAAMLPGRSSPGMP